MMKIPTNWIYIQNAYDEKNIFALQNELNSISNKLEEEYFLLNNETKKELEKKKILLIELIENLK